MPELAMYPEKPQALIDLSDGERVERAKEITGAWQYYDGDMKRPMKVKPGQPDDNVIVNLVGKMIDQSVELLFGDMPEFQLDDQDERSPDEMMLDAVWYSNRGIIFLNNLGTSGALAGHCFVKVFPTKEPQWPIRYVSLKPEQVTVFWAPDDIERVNAYMIYWKHGDVEHREDHYRDEVGNWRIRSMERTSRDWVILDDQAWPFPWPQIVDWQNLPDPREYYGEPDLQNPALNDVYNFVASNMQRIIRYHAHPRTIGTGFRAGDLSDTSVEAFWTIPNADAQVRNLEMQSDLASSMAFSQQVQAQFWAEHRGFDMTSIKDRLGQLTNFGLRTIMSDALNKASTKRELYGAGLNEINRRTMVLLGKGEDNTSRITWPTMIPENLLEQAQIQQLLLGMGVTSKASAAMSLGLDWEQEQRRLQDETAADDNIGARLLRAFEQGA